MNVLGVSGLCVLILGIGYLISDRTAPDVYELPIAEVYAKLAAADLGEANKPDFLTLETSNSGNGRDRLYWEKTSSHSYRKCRIDLTEIAEEPNHTHVAIACDTKSGTAGLAKDVTNVVMRAAMIERIDAALTDRPFDADRATSTASGWPGESFAETIPTTQEIDTYLRDTIPSADAFDTGSDSVEEPN